jgi:hypothetical protein
VSSVGIPSELRYQQLAEIVAVVVIIEVRLCMWYNLPMKDPSIFWCSKVSGHKDINYCKITASTDSTSTSRTATHLCLFYRRFAICTVIYLNMARLTENEDDVLTHGINVLQMENYIFLIFQWGEKTWVFDVSAGRSGRESNTVTGQ